MDFQAVDVNHARALYVYAAPVNSANSVGSSFMLAIAVMYIASEYEWRR
jgi:hypothetical protein